MKKTIILVERDFQDMEVMYPFYRLKEAGMKVVVAGTEKREYRGKYGYPINADGKIEEYNPQDFDAVVIPGGWAPDYLRRSKAMVNFVKEMDKKGKVVAAICHAGWLLCSANILKGRKSTSVMAIKDDMVHAGALWQDKEVVVDKNFITSRKPDDLPAFMREILKKMK